jgi:hypothetical protein
MFCRKRNIRERHRGERREEVGRGCEETEKRKRLLVGG